MKFLYVLPVVFYSVALASAEAMYKTGIRYQYGLNTALQSNEEASRWLKKANAAGYRDAQRQLDELAGAQ